jgi:NTP pyrophosphatase (non-canonical NTP hydrolase)
MTPTLAELTRRLAAFRDARDWRRFHTLKNLLVAAEPAAVELPECVQWLTDAEAEAAAADPAFKKRLGEECADVLLYLLMICERVGIDLADAAARKIEANALRYPAAEARGNARKATKL